MSSSSASSKSQPKAIIETIIEAGKKAFDPSLDATTCQSGLKEYDELIEKSETWTLLPALNALIKPNILPQWLREPFLQTLTRIPLRPDGVRSTMEFVFSVHPSNHRSGADGAPDKQGAAITHEAVAVATKLLSSVPSPMDPQEWFDRISGQLLSLMDGEGGPDLSKTAAQIVGFGILGKKQWGAPGAPGWNAFVQPLLQTMNPSIHQQDPKSGVLIKDEEPEVIDLSQDRVLVKADSLHTALDRLRVLILSNPSPGLCRRVLKPVLLQIWTIASWPSPQPATEERFCKPALDLFKTYLRLFGDAENVTLIIRILLCNGSSEGTEKVWRYRVSGKGDVDIVEPRGLNSSQELDLNWNEIEHKSTLLVDLLATYCSTQEVSSTFLGLLRKWFKAAGKDDRMDIDIRPVDTESKSSSPVQDLVDVTILQKLMDKAPDKLVSHFDQLLELVCQVFKADAQSNLGDDLMVVVLSLLSLVITAPTFQKSDIQLDDLKVVESSLERLSQEDRASVSPTARNLSLLLKYRDDVEQPGESTPAPNTRQVEDRKMYSLAMNYITGGNDNPPPVVSEGLSLLSGLIVAESPILDIPAIAVLMSTLLAESEDYINLRVVKVFTQLADKHPKATVQEILDHYLDAQEKLSTDTRLRFGEALLQVIERLGETFTGDVAQKVCETLLSIAGRRGYRPKTMKKQAREEKLANMKSKKAAEDDDDDLLDEDEELTEQEKAKNDILAQIVQGWESKRGSEDIRMRTSALSIHGTALETNIGGVGPNLASTSVDLCVNVLTLERDLDTAILRRAAILNILSFVRALDCAKEAGRSLGFGLTDQSREDIVSTLKYVAGTDGDGLVKQHAEDVIESLENWRMANLLPNQRGGLPEMTSLAGLHVNPGGQLVDAGGRPRPRIEEIE